MDLVAAGLEVDMEVVLSLHDSLLVEVSKADVRDEVEFFFLVLFAVDALIAVLCVLIHHSIHFVVIQNPLLRLFQRKPFLFFLD